MGFPGLYAGLLLTEVVSGAACSVGTAWVKELSKKAPFATFRITRQPVAHQGAFPPDDNDVTVVTG